MFLWQISVCVRYDSAALNNMGCVQVDWKLTRGSWRPKLLDYAKEHSEKSVSETSMAAFKLASARIPMFHRRGANADFTQSCHADPSRGIRASKQARECTPF